MLRTYQFAQVTVGWWVHIWTPELRSGSRNAGLYAAVLFKVFFSTWWKTTFDCVRDELQTNLQIVFFWLDNLRSSASGPDWRNYADDTIRFCTADYRL